MIWHEKLGLGVMLACLMVNTGLAVAWFPHDLWLLAALLAVTSLVASVGWLRLRWFR